MAKLDQGKQPLGHRILMRVLFTITIIVFIYFLYSGWDYYFAPRVDRGHMDMHELWKASGNIGHGLGFVGSSLMLLMMLYIPRKRWRFLQNIGKLRQWLDIHIWMGITGPLLITLHSTFKFGGIVSVSYWSMIAVALSGVLGRYVYMQIPRTLSGTELSEQEIDDMDESLQREMHELEGVDEELVTDITRSLTSGAARSSKGLAAVFAWAIQDITRPFRTRKLVRRLRRDTNIPRSCIRELIDLAGKRSLLLRRRAFLTIARKTLHHWHVVHRPFAVIMFIIMFVHIGVAVLFGYTWIF